VPAAYTYGNSGGDILRGDYSGTVDISLFKQFSLTERMKLQFRAEVFNLPNAAYFNAPAVNTPNTNIDVAAGGQITSTSNNPRQIQFGLKLNF
jgi:hypothetical protein